jgi:hypothetical protein
MIPSPLLDRRPLVWVVAGALVLLTVVAQLSSLGTPDMGLFLYLAGRVLDGARLYRDIIESNPPAIIALNLPVVLAARALGVSEFAVYRLASAAALVAVLLLCRHLLRAYVAPDHPRFRRVLLLTLVFLLFPLAGEDFGQREHFVLAAFVPYLLLVAARARGAVAPRGLGGGVGLLAGAGLALKPQYGLLLGGVELWRLLQRSDRRRILTPEAVAALGSLVAYALLIVLLLPGYVGLVAALGPAYMTFLRVSWLGLLLLAPAVPLVLFSLLAGFTAMSGSREPGALTLLMLAVAICFAVAAVQQKGLRYHFYPSVGLAVVLLVLCLAMSRPAGTLAARLYRRATQLLLACIVLVVTGEVARTAADGTPADRRARDDTLRLAEFVRQRARGTPVGVLSYHIASAFPLVNYAGVPLASRFPCLWLLPASYWGELGRDEPLQYRPPEMMPAPERYLNEAVREDLIRARPRVLLVLRPAPDERRHFLRRLDYLHYFGRQPALAEFFAAYRLIAARGEYDVYERQAGAERSRAPETATPQRSSSSAPVQSSPNRASQPRE